ncbi:hypothetical protein HDV01_004904 [Terramyces sp. JEL0728]|nr:hypothetical protein HDV01_004904 [Terramyces sp. JEL0728]
MITTFAKKRKIIKQDRFDLFLQQEKQVTAEEGEPERLLSKDKKAIIDGSNPKRQGRTKAPRKDSLARTQEQVKVMQTVGDPVLEPQQNKDNQINELLDKPPLADVFSMLISQSPTKKKRKAEMKIREVSQSSMTQDSRKDVELPQERNSFLNSSQTSSDDQAHLEKIFLSGAFESRYKATEIPVMKRRGNTFLTGSDGLNSQGDACQSQSNEMERDDLDETEIDEGLESSDDDMPKIKAYHHLKESGNNQMILDEIEYIFSGINSKSLKVKRNSLYELYSKLKDDFMNLFTIHGYLEKLFLLLNKNVDSTVRIPLVLIICKIKGELKQTDFCQWLFDSISLCEQGLGKQPPKKKLVDIVHNRFVEQVEIDFKTLDICEILLKHLSIPTLKFNDIQLADKQVGYFKLLISSRSALVYPIIVKLSKSWKHADTIVPFYESLDDMDISSDEFMDIVSILINLYSKDNAEMKLPDLDTAKLFSYLEQNISNDAVNLLTCLLVNIETVTSRNYPKKQLEILKKNMEKEFPTNAYTSILMGSIYLQQRFTFNLGQAISHLEDFHHVQNDIGIKNDQVLDLINKLKDIA